MTKEEIIEMARQAGFFINDKLTVTSPFIENICISPMLKEFAKLVAEHGVVAPQRTWVGLEKSDMPDGADPLFDDPKFIAGMVYAANKLKEKNI